MGEMVTFEIGELVSLVSLRGDIGVEGRRDVKRKRHSWQLTQSSLARRKISVSTDFLL